MITTTRALSAVLTVSVLDALFYGLMVGLGESYFSAFALALGMSEFQTALVSTLPIVIGGFLQIGTSYWAKRLGSYKIPCTLLVLLQALSFLPLVWGALRGTLPFALLLLLITSYWTCAMMAGPIWNGWLKALVPPKITSRFFSKRSFYIYLAILLSLLGSGLLLERFRQNQNALTAFAILFGLATLVRLISFGFLLRHPDGEVHAERLHTPRLRELFGLHKKGRHNLVIYQVVLLKIGVYFSAPFFTPYMLVQMKLNYREYMSVLICALIGKMVAMQVIHRLRPRFSTQKALALSTLGICFSPLLWCLAPSLGHIWAVELLSGICWAICDLSFFLILFNNAAQDDQITLLSSYNLLNTSAIFLGLIPGMIVFHLFANSATIYLLIFLISTLLRLASVLPFALPVLLPTHTWVWPWRRPAGQLTLPVE